MLHCIIDQAMHVNSQFHNVQESRYVSKPAG